MDYKPKGVCSQQIHFDIIDNKVRNVSFVGGCNGNLQGISRLIDGMDVDEAIPASKASAVVSRQLHVLTSLLRH